MAPLFMVMLIVGATALPAAGADDDAWFASDKYAHGVGSLALESATYWTLRDAAEWTPAPALTLAAAGTLAAGMAKELTDATFSERDLVWDAAGTALGTLLWSAHARWFERVAFRVTPTSVALAYRRRGE